VSESDPPPGPSLQPFDEIYEREFDRVCRTLGRLGVPPNDLQDAAHEVFLVLYRRWNEIDKTRARPWLFGVARRVAADIRVKRREALAEIDPPAVEDPRIVQRDLVWRALDALDDDRREVVVLHDLEGYTGAEIATMLDLPTNTVHSRLRLARADLVASVQRLRGAK
jgi:RNA polymerase sigma-70 factor (ECF subfamily)